MKKVRVEDSVGLTICHDITAMFDGFKGPLFKRGHVIREEDIERLLDIGKRSIFVYEENAGEIHEEEAAVRLGNLSKIENFHMTKPSEGKITGISDTEGILIINKELMHKVNSIKDITICTLPNHYHVSQGTCFSSMRVVPLMIPEERIKQAEEICKGDSLYKIVPFSHRKVAVIITGSEVYHGRIIDKFESVARKKLSKYPCDIIGVTICDDSLEMITNVSNKYLQEGADLIIYSGGMSVDPDDLTPTVIRETGADIISYGVPSQPGNMTLIAYKGIVALIGVPGAAISMPTTIFDAVLPQLFTDIRFTKEDLINLSEGGLCQKCASCHFPNCTFGRY